MPEPIAVTPDQFAQAMKGLTELEFGISAIVVGIGDLELVYPDGAKEHVFHVACLTDFSEFIRNSLMNWKPVQEP